MAQLPQAVHRTIVVVDVEGSGDRRRTNPHQVAMRAGMYQALERAFGDAHIPWTACYHEDRGDGLFVLVPAELPKAPFAEEVPQALAASLHEHNSVHSAEARIRLRMALHAGEVIYDGHGVAATSITAAFRLLDADPLKAALAQSPGVLALIASAWFFEEVVRHSPASNPDTYRQVEVSVKETNTMAWISLPDQPYPPRVPLAFARNGGYRIAPSPKDFFAFVDALESVPCMRSENTRSLVLDQLRPAIAGSVRHYSQRRAQMISLLQTCLDYRDGVRELLMAIANVEQDGSVSLQRLVDLLGGTDL